MRVTGRQLHCDEVRPPAPGLPGIHRNSLQPFLAGSKPHLQAQQDGKLRFAAQSGPGMRDARTEVSPKRTRIPYIPFASLAICCQSGSMARGRTKVAFCRLSDAAFNPMLFLPVAALPSNPPLPLHHGRRRRSGTPGPQLPRSRTGPARRGPTSRDISKASSRSYQLSGRLYVKHPVLHMGPKFPKQHLRHLVCDIQ